MAVPDAALTCGPVRLPRVWTMLLIPGGMAAGHVVGYAMARAIGATPAVTAHHGYVGDLFMVAVPLTAMVLVRAFVSGMRDESPPVRFTSLALAQVLLFLSVELLEHAAVGIGAGATMTEATVLCGIVGQLLVAWLIVAIVRASYRAGASARTHRISPARARTSLRWGRPLGDRISLGVSVWSLSRRGPPVAA